jgi:hypothetical protein
MAFRALRLALVALLAGIVVGNAVLHLDEVTVGGLHSHDGGKTWHAH